jgi:diketogulonate reductase-like aldo/keto reductase
VGLTDLRGTALFGKENVQVIKKALSTGYRYLDGAQMYKNSESIGTALKESGVKRDDVFILTKRECDMRYRADGQWARTARAAMKSSRAESCKRS